MLKFYIKVFYVMVKALSCTRTGPIYFTYSKLANQSERSFSIYFFHKEIVLSYISRLTKAQP